MTKFLLMAFPLYALDFIFKRLDIMFRSTEGQQNQTKLKMSGRSGK